MMKRPVVNMEIVEAITKRIIEFDNKEGISWSQLYDSLLDEYNIKKFPERSDTMVQVIKKISMLDLEIFDRPFKLEKFKY